MGDNNNSVNNSDENETFHFNDNFNPINNNNNFQLNISFNFPQDQENTLSNGITSPAVGDNDNLHSQNFSHNVDNCFENMEQKPNPEKDNKNKENSKKEDESRPDTLRKKLKTLTLNKSMEFINENIKRKKDKIKNVDSKLTKNTKIDFEKEFMYLTLGDIFSFRVSSKYTSSVKDHENQNKYIIKELRIKNEKLNNIFNITFIQCLNHFIGKEKFEVLEGMKTIKETVFKGEKEKINLINYANDYEVNVSNSKERESFKGKKKLHKKEGNLFMCQNFRIAI